MSREEGSDTTFDDIFRDVEISAHTTAEKTEGNNKIKRLAHVQDEGPQTEYSA